MTPPRVIIIGAGPAGLTAALELLRRPTSAARAGGLDDVGGISRTVEYNGNRMDIGGHRFFSKSDWVMDWWREILPLALPRRRWRSPIRDSAEQSAPTARRQRRGPRDAGAQPPVAHLFPAQVSSTTRSSSTCDTLRNLGLVRCVRIGVSYAWASLFPRQPERTLEDFLVNRFGGELYRTFFKDYTEKVWGVPCTDISAEWGAQRIKGLSLVEPCATRCARSWPARRQPAHRRRRPA